MRIARDIYLEKLKRRIGNGMIKVITGIRRCGKSYLLSELFREYLASIGIDEPHIIEVALDDRANAALRDPDAMMALSKGTSCVPSSEVTRTVPASLKDANPESTVTP